MDRAPLLQPLSFTQLKKQLLKDRIHLSTISTTLSPTLTKFKKHLSTEEISFYKAIKTRKRKDEFIHSRVLLKEALREAGYDFTDSHLSLLPDEKDGIVILPCGDRFTCSLSHTTTLICAAVAEKRLYASIGVDCECLSSAPKALQSASRIAHACEVQSAKKSDTVSLILFSAKEALYKALFQLDRDIKIGFRDVVAVLEEDGQIGFLFFKLDHQKYVEEYSITTSYAMDESSLLVLTSVVKN